MGDMAEHADEQEGMREIARDIRTMLAESQAKRAWNQMSQSAKFEAAKSVYTHQNYPNATNYMLYQNVLMAIDMTTEQRMYEAKLRYAINRITKVGHDINCPGCNASFTKKSYQHVFCGVKVHGKSTCKDFCHNWFSTTRLERALKYINE